MPGLGLPTAEQDSFIDACTSYFLGEPNKLLNQKEGDAEGEEPAEEPPAEEEENEDGEGQ